MFTKLVKQEIHETWRVSTITALSMILISFFALILQITKYQALQTIGIFLGIAAPIAGVFGIFIYIANHYYQTMYGQRAYFTHVLPVKSSTILAAKTLWFYLLTLLALIATLFETALYNAPAQIKSTQNAFSEKLFTAFSKITDSLSALSALEISFYTLILLLGALVWVVFVLVVFAIANHHSLWRMSNTNALLISVLGGYLVYQAIAFISLLLPVQLQITMEHNTITNTKIITKQIFDLTTLTAGSSEAGYAIIPLGTPAAILALIIFGYLIAHQMLTKHLNLR